MSDAPPAPVADQADSSSAAGGGNIESHLHESRTFAPPEAFSQAAHISSEAEYQALWNRAKDDPEGFWGEQALDLLTWDTDFAAVRRGRDAGHGVVRRRQVERDRPVPRSTPDRPAQK